MQGMSVCVWSIHALSECVTLSEPQCVQNLEALQTFSGKVL